MEYLKKLVGAIVFVSMVGVSVVTLAQLFARHFSIEFPGGGELAILFAIWLYFMGMAHATFNDTHIQGGIEELVTNDVAKRVMRAISVAVLLLFSIIGLYLSVDMFATTVKHKYVSIYYQMPMTLSVAAVVLGFFLNVVAILWRIFTGRALARAVDRTQVGL